MHEANKELEEKREEKQETLKEWEKRFKKQKIRTEMTDLRVQNKNLQEMRKVWERGESGSGYSGRMTVLLLQLSLDKNSPIFLRRGKLYNKYANKFSVIQSII